MLFIWRGDGAWVPVTVIGIGIVVEVLVAVISVNQAKAHTNLVIACILATSSGVVYLIARRVRGTPGPLVKNRGPDRRPGTRGRTSSSSSLSTIGPRCSSSRPSPTS
jgi:hypothetical protein